MDLRNLLDKIISDAETGEKSPHRALAAPEMRSYLPDRRFLSTLAAGLRVILRGALRPTRKGLRAAFNATSSKKPAKDFQDRLEQVGAGVLVLIVTAAVLAGVAAAVGPRIAPAVPWIVAVGVLVLLIAALIVAPEQAPEKVRQPAQTAVPKVEEPAPEAASLSPEDVVRAIRQIATMRDWSGVHLTDLEDRLDTTREHLLDTLTEAGIEVSEQLKLRLPNGHQRNRQGVRLSALPQAPATPAGGPADRPAEEPAQPLPAPATTLAQSPG